MASQMTEEDKGEDTFLGQLEDSNRFGIQEQAVVGKLVEGQVAWVDKQADRSVDS